VQIPEYDQGRLGDFATLYPMVQQYLYQISNTPSTLIRMIDSIRPERYKEALAADRFTLVEIIAHLADWEEVFLDRITTAVEYPGNPVQGFSEDERAVEHHYADKDIHHELEVFENRRRDTVSYLLNLAEEDWSKTVIHSQNGEQSVMDIVQFVLGHDMYHVHQVSEYLK
jgi:uncharacterized damage-inducible protein DinB